MVFPFQLSCPDGLFSSEKSLIYPLFLQPGDFIHTLGDSHVYVNHVDALNVQLKRQLRPFPTLKIVRDISSIDDFKFEDFLLEGYKPHPKVEMKMAV